MKPAIWQENTPYSKGSGSVPAMVTSLGTNFKAGDTALPYTVTQWKPLEGK